jgi:hypothetical protein
MKKNIALVSILLAAVAQTAFANGVEKVLPADAHNVVVAAASLEEVATGLVKISDGNIDGPVYDNTYTTMLTVTVNYSSKDDSDVPCELTQIGDGCEPTGQPRYVVSLPVSDAEIAAIKSKKLDPKTLVSVTVTQQDVQIEQPGYQYKCSYNTEGGTFGNCVEPAVPMVTVSRPVLSVDHK